LQWNHSEVWRQNVLEEGAGGIKITFILVWKM